MPIYIIRPKANIVSQSLSLVSRKFNLESRQKQIKEVEAVYKEDNTYKTLIQWTEDIKRNEDITIITSPEKPGVAGIAIIEMSEEAAAKTQ